MEDTIKEFSNKIQTYIDSYDENFYEKSLEKLREHVTFEKQYLNR